MNNREFVRIGTDQQQQLRQVPVRNPEPVVQPPQPINQQHQLHQQHQQGDQHIRQATQSTSKCNKLFYGLLMLVMVVSTAINFITPFAHQVQQQPPYQSDFQWSQQLNLQQVKENGEQIVNHNHLQLSNKTIQRISYGQPRPKNNNIKAVIIQKRGTPPNFSICAITNGVTLITAKSLETAKALLNEESVNRWIVLLGQPDTASQQILSSMPMANFQRKNIMVPIDANYDFFTNSAGGCSSIIFMQNTFVVDAQNAKQIVNAAKKLDQQQKNGYVGFSQSAKIMNEIKVFEDLRVADLSTLKQKTINQYLYIFDAKFLQVITPFNFVHYAKYVVEQMLINPVLAITQKSDKLVPLKGNFHGFDEVYDQFKQLPLKQPLKYQNGSYSLCFVSYPSNPNTVSTKQLENYLKSIADTLSSSHQGIKTNVVVYIPFDSIQKQSLFQSYAILKQVRQIYPKLNLKIRLRIKPTRAVSSLAVYESAHTFCPDSSLIIASRHNIQFEKNFVRQLSQSVSQKFHFYYSGNSDYASPSEQTQNYSRFNMDQFNQKFSMVHIFKSSFMKMINLWVLKKSQSQFYQTEASFILPLLQMSDQLNIKKLPILFKISSARDQTPNQINELKSLQTYSKWSKLKDNTIHQIEYNSLTNPNLRNRHKQQIPKIIHQVWLRDEQIPNKVQKLQSTIKEINKDYKYQLWRKQYITHYDFPMSYTHIARALQYEWAYNKNMHLWAQALLSYELLFNYGGFYIALNAQAKKPLDQFLKYQLFFAGYQGIQGYFDYPYQVSRGIIGTKRYNYQLRIVLTQILTQRRLDFSSDDLQAIVGGQVLRISLLDEQLFTNVGFGFQLMNYQPDGNTDNLCNFSQIPCKYYPQAYMVFHYFK